MKKNIIFTIGLISIFISLFIGWDVYNEKNAYSENTNLKMETNNKNISSPKLYKYMELGGYEGLYQLNSLGRQGWIVCGILYGAYHWQIKTILLYREIE